MSYGSNEAVDNADDNYREKCVQLIAQRAAELVATRNMGRKEAIAAAAEWLRNEQAADFDSTGVVASENVLPSPSKTPPVNQVAAIRDELLDAASDAADDLF